MRLSKNKLSGGDVSTVEKIVNKVPDLHQLSSAYATSVDIGSRSPEMFARFFDSISYILSGIVSDIELQNLTLNDKKTITLAIVRHYGHPDVLRRIQNINPAVRSTRMYTSENDEYYQRLFDNKSNDESESDRYENLPEKIPKLAEPTEWFDDNMSGEEAISKNGEWFYNTRDTDHNGKILRVYDRVLLHKIRNSENPFTRRKWGPDVLARFSIGVVHGGETSGYHLYNKRRYLVRTGPRGGKYITVKSKKIRV